MEIVGSTFYPFNFFFHQHLDLLFFFTPTIRRHRNREQQWNPQTNDAYLTPLPSHQYVYKHFATS